MTNEKANLPKNESSSFDFSSILSNISKNSQIKSNNDMGNAVNPKPERRTASTKTSEKKMSEIKKQDTPYETKITEDKKNIEETDDENSIEKPKDEIEVSEEKSEIIKDTEVVPEELLAVMQEIPLQPATESEASKIEEADLVIQIDHENVEAAEEVDLVPELNSEVIEASMTEEQPQAEKNLMTSEKTLGSKNDEVVQAVSQSETPPVQTSKPVAQTEAVEVTENTVNQTAETVTINPVTEEGTNFTGEAFSENPNLMESGENIDIEPDAETFAIHNDRIELENLQFKQLNAPNGKINRRNVVEQILNRMKFEIKDTSSSVRITLHPENLGDVSLKIVTENGIISAQFVAENERVKEIIQSNFNLLKNVLEEKGVIVSSLSVSVSTEQNESLFNSFARGSNNFSKKSPNAVQENPIISADMAESIYGLDIYDASVNYEA